MEIELASFARSLDCLLTACYMPRSFIITIALILAAVTVAGGLFGKQPAPLQLGDAMAKYLAMLEFANVLKLAG